MNECEVIAGRAYTGPLNVKMNGSLRKAGCERDASRAV